MKIPLYSFNATIKHILFFHMPLIYLIYKSRPYISPSQNHPKYSPIIVNTRGKFTRPAKVTMIDMIPRGPNTLLFPLFTLLIHMVSMMIGTPMQKMQYNSHKIPLLYRIINIVIERAGTIYE